mgnify:CR=1 FL=1
MPKVTVTINGRDVQVDEGLNFIEAARVAGVEIPHFCYHPGLGVDGNCRMCLVEVEGVGKPQIACNTFAREGVKIHTDTENVKGLQASVLEFLFLNHPLDCAICDQSGECYLQDYYMSNGQYDSRLDTPKVHKRKAALVGPRVVLDAERCVLCTRCIRFCDQVTGTGELYIVNRGNRSEITTYPNQPLDNEYSLNTVDLCPVGALTNTDFRFKKRVWFLQTVDSICGGCARGCNVHLEQHEGVVYRTRPRENMEVNRYWMCDPGRVTYHRFNDDRLDVALAGEAMVALDEGIRRAASWIEAAAGKGIVLLLSPESSVETLYAAKRFAGAAGAAGAMQVVSAATRPAGVEDAILRKADPYPNREGMGALGLSVDAAADAAAGAALAKGGGLLLVIDDDPFGQKPEWTAHADRFDHLLYLGCLLYTSPSPRD